MSYNITSFKLKKLDGIKFPVSSLYENERKDWHPDRSDNDDGTVTFKNLETTISGTVENDIFHMTGISCCGEGSGTIMNDMLVPAFKKSNGILSAVCIWEGGDCVQALDVNDGQIRWREVEL